MIVETARFGKLNVDKEDLLTFPMGLLGFEQFKNFFLVDTNDDTCIMWLQSSDLPQLAFPIIEPELFLNSFRVRLSKSELESIELQSLKEAKVFTILTIPENIVDMTANLKAPLVLNAEKKTARQCVLQDNEYSVRHPMFVELKSRLTQVGTTDVIREAGTIPSVVKDGKLRKTFATAKTEIQI